MIMVSVFLAFVVNGDPTVKQFGLGMAVAVAVDATVVRCVLVPAIINPAGPVLAKGERGSTAAGAPCV
jgi:RND superfamily putative drug exporter